MRRRTESRFAVAAALLAVAITSLVRGQTPVPPPRPLPPSVTGANPAPAPVSPASGTTQLPPAAAAAPIARFQRLQSFPPETVQAVYAMRAGADWLSRMNQSNGRFLPGLNPTLRAPLEDDHDLRQAFAAYALADAARFTGDQQFAARATQAVLVLLSQTRPDPADAACRVPATPPERCDPVGFAAVAALAVYALPNADPKLLAQAEELCAFLRKHALDNPAPKADADALNLSPGLAVQALAASNRAKPDAAKRDVLAKAVGHYRGMFKSRPTPVLAAALIPGFVDFCLQSQGDKETAAAVYELADWLCGCQYSRTDARSGAWVGGFTRGQPPAQSLAEPGFESALCAGALADTTRLTRHVPDLTRFRRYRQAAVEGLTFARMLQFSDENADHFERGFRTRFLVGGVHLTPTDGTARIDAAAYLVTAHLAFLQSGAEGQTE